MLNYKWITNFSSAVYGEFKTYPEDFVVEEIPAYPFSGNGQHLVLQVKKRNLTTIAAVRLLSEALGMDARNASWAGLKDAFAVTTQWLSLDTANMDEGYEDKLKNFSSPDLEILQTSRHDRKIRTGHLRGNLFKLVIRNVQQDSVAHIEQVLSKIQEVGFPNYFGKQRFGKDGRNVEKALGWIGGEEATSKRQARKRQPRKRFERKLLVSALQSHLFNQYLAQRIEQGNFSKPLSGDWMKKEDTGGLFLSEDIEVDTKRMDDWEISPTGPMFGTKMDPATHEAQTLEQQVLDDAALGIQHFAKVGKLAMGTRRLLRIRPQEVAMRFENNCLFLNFSLSKGSYATVLLGELFKDGLVEPNTN